MGNRTAMTKTAEDGTVAEWHRYGYNESNQLVSEELYDGKKTTSLSYEYDADELLVAMAYDGDGNRVFQINYNLHTDDDWKGNSGNGNGSNKDNAGSGSSSSSDVTEDSSDSSIDESTDSDNSAGDSSDTRNDNSSSNNGNGKKKDKTNNGNSGNSSANNGKGGNGKNNGNTKKGSNANNSSTSDCVENTEGSNSTSADTTTSSDSETGADSVATVSTISTGNGNATNAEENNSQNQCGILFPVDSEVSDTEASLIDMIKTEGKQKNYELIEYINDVNRAYTEVLVEQNINGKLDTAYIYGVDRLSLDRFDGSNGYYLYDPRGSVTGITNEDGQLYQSYRYDAFGAITFGAPQYENEYTYNGESYNPNIESQYLRARYYDVVNGNFLTEDSYLGDITEPLTLNRYNYCVSSPLNYVDPSGHKPLAEILDNKEQLWREVEELYPDYTLYEKIVEYSRQQLVKQQQRIDERGDAVYEHYISTLSGNISATVGRFNYSYISIEVALREATKGNWDSREKQEQAIAHYLSGVQEKLQYYEEMLLSDGIIYSAIWTYDYNNKNPLPAKYLYSSEVSYDENFEEYFRQKGQTFLDDMMTLGIILSTSTVSCEPLPVPNGSANAIVPNVPQANLPAVTPRTSLALTGGVNGYVTPIVPLLPGATLGASNNILNPSVGAITNSGPKSTTLAGSNLKHLNGAIGELQGYRMALQNGEIGIQPPGKVTAPGPDYITYNPNTGVINIWDSKYSSVGKWPNSAKGFGSERWLNETRQAIQRIPDSKLRMEILRAFEEGKIQWNIFKWPQ